MARRLTTDEVYHFYQVKFKKALSKFQGPARCSAEAA